MSEVFPEIPELLKAEENLRQERFHHEYRWNMMESIQRILKGWLFFSEIPHKPGIFDRSISAKSPAHGGTWCMKSFLSENQGTTGLDWKDRSLSQVAIT